MGVQIRIPSAAVPVGEGGRDQAADVDLPDPLRPVGEQGMLLDERQSVLHSRLTGAFDDSCHPGFGDRPQGRGDFTENVKS